MHEFSQKYLEFLKKELSGINLTRILDPDEFYYKQIQDSILPALECDTYSRSISAAKYIVDVGFGGGFPIIPLAKHFDKKNFYGFEARSKKVTAVKKIASYFGLNNVHLYHYRIEDILFDKKVLITFKAVGKVQDFLLKINTTSQVKIFFYKGPGYKEQDILEIPGFKLISQEDIEIPQTERRIILGFENVPHGTNQKKTKKMHKNLVKFSSLI
jgi:16S rRNA (guanine527-N7)-methyltransferase